MIIFKRLFVAFTLLCALSCQKEYAPEPTAGSPSTGGGSSSGGSSNSSGTLLSQLSITSGTVTTTKAFEYNSAGKMIKCTETSLVSGQSFLSSHTFTRDNNNKIISYLLTYNIPGFPANGVVYTCHYPAGSDLFDYVTAKYTFSGTTEADSIVFTIANNTITSEKTYQDISNTGYQLGGNSTFSYDNSGNLSNFAFYDLTAVTGSKGPAYTIVYTYDTKLNGLQLGQEAFILGGDIHISKNNYVKQVRTDYTTVAAGDVTTTNFAYNYNSNNRPTGATGSDSKGTTAVITYTYK